MVLLSSRRVFVYDQVLLSKVKSQLAILCDKVTIQAIVT
jgi:hypothetical protein